MLPMVNSIISSHTPMAISKPRCRFRPRQLVMRRGLARFGVCACAMVFMPKLRLLR